MEIAIWCLSILLYCTFASIVAYKLYYSIKGTDNYYPDDGIAVLHVFITIVWPFALIVYGFKKVFIDKWD